MSSLRRILSKAGTFSLIRSVISPVISPVIKPVISPVINAVISVMLASAPAFAWDATGHRIITVCAMERFPDAPAWLKERSSQVVDQSVVPDRWRGVRVAQLTHVNNPDHYLDVDELADFGLTMETMSPLRHEFVAQLVTARLKPDFKGRPVNEARDPDKTLGYPGFLPHAALENYGRLVSAFKVIRVIEKLDDLARAPQLEATRGAAVNTMGVISHFIGDAAQPLHTTIHHHGWIGENPNAFTTDRGFHAYIDGTIIRHHALGVAEVRDAMKDIARDTNDPRNPWSDVLKHVDRSFQQVVPLYELQKSGDLERAPGKTFIASRLADGAAMLGAIYEAAWKASEPTEAEIKDFIRYDNFDEFPASEPKKSE